MTFLIFVLSALRRANRLLDEVIPGWVFFFCCFSPLFVFNSEFPFFLNADVQNVYCSA